MSSERRHSPRHNAHLQAEIEIDGHVFGGSLTRDASETGLLLVTDADTAVGDAVTIRCELGGSSLSVTGKVARRRPTDGKLFEIAVLLSAKNPLVAEIFRQLERSASQPPPSR